MGKLTKQTPRDRKKRTRARYTEAQKIQAVTAMLQAGTTGPLSYEAQAAARAVLGAEVSKTALLSWLTQYRPTIEATDKSLVAKPLDIPTLINSTRETVIRNLNSAVVKLSARISNDAAIETAAIRDAAVTLGIAVEKIVLLTGRDPELDAEVNGLRQDCQGTSYSPIDLIQSLRLSVQRNKSALYPSIDVTPNP